MKKYFLITIFYFMFTDLHSQLLERHTYKFPIPARPHIFYDTDEQYGTTFTFLQDGGYCIGAQIVYPFQSGMGSTDERQILFKLDSTFNVEWIDSFMVFADYYPFHDVITILETPDQSIIAPIDTLINSKLQSAFHKDSTDGSTLLHNALPGSVGGDFLTVSNMLIINDTIFISGDEGATGPNTPVYGATDLNGDMLFIKNYDSLFLGPSTKLQEASGQFYLISRGNSGSNYFELISKIDHAGNILSSDTIWTSYSSEWQILIYDSSRVALFHHDFSNVIRFLDLDNNITDSVESDCNITKIFKGPHGQTLLSCNCDSTSAFNPGSYIFMLDSLNLFSNGVHLNNKDQIRMIKPFNDSEIYASGIDLTDYSILFLKAPNVFQRPHINSSSTTLCYGDSVLISAPPGFGYKWSNGDTTQNISTGIPGIYYVILEDSNRSVFISDTINLVLSDPSFTLGNDTTLCSDQSITLSGPQGMMSYLWSDFSNTQNTTIFTTQPEDTLYYTLIVTDNNGCSWTDDIEIIFDNCNDVSEINSHKIKLIPNPAHSLVKLFVKENENPEYLLEIFNENKQLLFSNQIKAHSSIDLTDFSRGKYLYTIHQDGKVISKGMLILN
jgi:hypothetical protein